MVFAVHLAGDQGQLGMDFVIIKAIEHRAASFFQLFGPVDVVLLVKAGAQLHHGGNFLAVFRCIDQRLHDLGIACHAVQGHFDADNIRVGTCFHQHADERADALVRVREQNVMFVGFGIQIIIRGGLNRAGWRIGKSGVAVCRNAAGQAEQKPGVQRRSLGIAAVRRDHQLVPQELDDLLRSAGPELQAHSGQLAALFQQLAHHIAEVDIMIHHALVHRDIRIAGHTEQTGVLQRAFIKDAGGVMGDQLIRKGKACGAVWIFDKQQLLKLAAEGDNAVIYTVILAVELGGIINFFIAQERERVALVHHLWAQDGQDFRGEICFPVVLLLLVQVVKIDLDVLVLFQGGK